MSAPTRFGPGQASELAEPPREEPGAVGPSHSAGPPSLHYNYMHKYAHTVSIPIDR